MAIVSKQSFTQAQKKSGPLVRVEISRGRFVKMHKDDAIAAGHIPAPAKAVESKRAAPLENKMILPVEDKAAAEPVAVEEARPDDFTSIPGIGRATARALQARGITTFEQLRQAGQLEYVSDSAKQAIERWRNG